MQMQNGSSLLPTRNTVANEERIVRTLKDFENEDAIFSAIIGGGLPLQEFRKLWQENHSAGWQEGYDDGWQTGLDQGQFSMSN